MFLTALLLSALIGATSSDNLDSLLISQQNRAGQNAESLFLTLNDTALTQDELSDYRFLLAYMSLSDLALVGGNDLLDNVRFARDARSSFAWGVQLTDELYNHFVLPHRVSQEPFINGWRSLFKEQLTPRLEGMTMTEAVLEINHWCHELVTFKQTDGRDQDALTTIRSGFGRCEEEMIFTICALRSVGIPARQCYTPYWAHTDNNHAWVEVWSDGKWHHLGACEPEPVLDQAWFTHSARRAMMVVSTAYGDYHGDEPILSRFGNSTLINSTAVYGSPQKREIKLLDHKGKPIPDHRIIFSLFNYGCLNPAVSLKTDDNGICQIICGPGDWIISAGDNDYSALYHSTVNDTFVELKLGKIELLNQITEIDYSPPSDPPKLDHVEKDTLFKQRLTFEDSKRNDNVWTRWAVEAGIDLNSDIQQRPDSLYVLPLSNAVEEEVSDVLELLECSSGNWGHLWNFLTGSYPRKSPTIRSDLPYLWDQRNILNRYLLLTTLSDKGLRAYPLIELEHHYYNTSISNPLASIDNDFANSLDSLELDRYLNYVVAPRIDYEPFIGWRQPLISFLADNPALISSKNDKQLLKWLRKNIALDDRNERLGTSLPLGLILELQRGSHREVGRLYIGLCRVRDIPARFNPITGILERWDNEWTEVVILNKKKKKKIGHNGMLVIDADSGDTTIQQAKYYKHWAVQKWNCDVTHDIDFGYEKQYIDMIWPQELPIGLYCLTTGFRRKDGSAPVSLTWFEIKKGKQTKVALKFRNLQQ